MSCFIKGNNFNFKNSKSVSQNTQDVDYKGIKKKLLACIRL